MKRIELVRCNRHRSSMDYKAINFGIGIHTGELMLGTVGENLRMDSTVISNAVNLASRIESLTKKYRVGVAISEDTKQALSEGLSCSITFLGRERVKGKHTEVGVYQVEPVEG